MPFAQVNGVKLFYHLDGRDDRPAILLSHSLGVDHAQWDQQTADLLPYFRVLRYDIRGHGASDAPAGDYSIEMLGRDVLAIADAAGLDKFAFCGLSLGGMIGQWLGANAADRLTFLVLANTTPRANSPSSIEERRTKVLNGGMAAVVDSVMQRFFSAGSLDANYPAIATTKRTFLATNPVGYAGCCAAFRDMDHRLLVRAIRTPTMIVFGDLDVSTPWKDNGEILASSIPNPRVVGLPTAHLSNLEAPRSFSAALFDFLLRRESFSCEEGFAKRREVLGGQHVDRAVSETTDFNREFQDHLTRYAWGTIWTRPHLDQRSRRLLALTTLASMGRWEEFRMHVRTGLAHELEPCDLKELLLQISVYAGIPAANTGFHIAAEELQRPKN
jgi:3-oxoadipate enol-lactonase / 4-carboxymuconolactone decarboxylase